MESRHITKEIYIASMNMRGKWAEVPPGLKKINVTSAQAKLSKYRLAFSPMTEIEGGYKEFFCFENYWQSGKRYEGLDDPENVEKQLEWWKKQTTGRRRYPLGKGKKVKHAKFPDFTEFLTYIPSRKQVYVPEYHNLIKDNPVLTELKTDETTSYVVYDFDGPRTEDGEPTFEKVTLEMLIDKLNDPRHPFGHGYIVAAAIAGIDIKKYNI